MKKIIVLLSVLWFGILQASAITGDTLRVISHNDTLVVTNPSAGVNPYTVWAVFPPDSVKYRKVVLHLNYRCPPGMNCGAWDYIDNVFLRRLGGVNGDTANIEITRFITPYGGGFSSTWHAEWHMDVTDYAAMLHDSVEVEYRHTGYETNTVGWMVTVAFDFIEGTPVAEPVKLRQMWNGSFLFGSSTNPIDSHLQPITFTTDSLTRLIRLHLVQSGHGSDTSGCSEFCYPFRYLYYDSVLVNSKQIKRACGTNPLYPQAGTWVYDRGNWCPGALVNPDLYTYTVAGNSQHTLDINMQAYTVPATATPSGRYYFESQLIEYQAPAAVNDASIEEIFAPSDLFENSRINPVCSNPQMLLRNNGSAPLTSAQIKYGLAGQPEYTFNWSGNLAIGSTVQLNLSNMLVADSASTAFRAYVASVNGGPDDYPYDDTAHATAVIPATVDSVIVFQFKTNSRPNDNSYTVKNQGGTTLYQRLASSLAANTDYSDTLHLPTGCYTFLFNDAGNDGLYFTSTSSQGGSTSYARFVTVNNQLIKQFNKNFGRELRYNFFVDTLAPVGVVDPELRENKILVYPNPGDGLLNIEVYNPKKEDLKISVINSMGQVIYQSSHHTVAARIIDLDLTGQPPGVYFIKVESATVSAIRRYSLIH